MPALYIITGSNGAGKSSIGGTYLPEHIQYNVTVFDGDKLYMDKQKELWSQGMTAIKEAKKLALQYVTETFEDLVEIALSNNQEFAYEGHFTNDATWDVPKRFKDNGYTVCLIFLGVANPDISELRVKDRVKDGGHFVDRRTVEDNFYGNLEKLNQYDYLIDDLTIVDTSEAEHQIIYNSTRSGIIMSLSADDMPDWFTAYLPDLAKRIK